MEKQIRRSFSLTPEQAISLYYQLGLFQYNVMDRTNTLYTESVKFRARILKLYPEIRQYVEK